jgi:hypothetical protein
MYSKNIKTKLGNLFYILFLYVLVLLPAKHPETFFYPETPAGNLPGRILVPLSNGVLRYCMVDELQI